MNYKILRLPQVCQITGKSRTAIYDDMNAGKFPHHIETGKRSRGWLEEDINAWVWERIEEARAKTRQKSESLKNLDALGQPIKPIY